VLQELLPDLSRTSVQRMIAEGGAKVNGSAAKAGYRLRAGDVLTWEPAPHAAETAAPEPEAIPLDVRFEDEELLVLNKPKGLVVHPAPGHWSGTLVNAVLAHAGDDLAASGTDRPGIVHRLDKDTSGLMVVAKTDAAHASLQAQIQERSAERR